MAYAALISLEQTTDLILNHVKYSISVDERKQIASIREYVILFISFLENSPEKTNQVEGKIRDLASEAENLIEFFMWNQNRMSLWRFSLSRVKFRRRLKRLKEKIGSITGDMMDDHFITEISSPRVAATGKNDVVIGLDDDLIAIKSRLCGESHKLEVIPIVGMGGIGKTTLARNAYDDSLIKEYFHIRAFIQVSQDYSVRKILSNLLASIKVLEEEMSGEKNESVIAEKVYKSLKGRSESVIAEKVYKNLKGRRYVIVMDDIWSTEAWDDVRNVFPDDNNGSRIVLTTRLSGVAAYASSDSLLHEMKFMDENQSWNLLKQKVFTDGGDCPRELEDMGKAIAEGCRGLPLAVVLVAGILSTIVRTRASWEKVVNNVNSVVDGQLDKILSLSYTLLPHHLRPCFLFIGGFPEHHNIHVSWLVKLWVAEGFLRGENGCKSLEEEAEEYLEDLVKRSLVLITSRKSNGKIKSCSLHDLVRDLCIRKAQEEKFLLMDRYVLTNRRIDERRISLVCSRLNEIRCPTIHTVLGFQNSVVDSSIPFAESLRLLRVLDVTHDNYLLLLPQVFELFHLRYLAAGFTYIPAAISKLQNLQTLIIRPRILLLHEPSPSYLPLEIWKMQQLRHLVLPDFYMLPDPADEQLLPLENLQTLSVIASFVCSKRILEMVPNLKKLGIIYFRNGEHHNLENLVHLHQLEKLKITASQMFSWHGQYPAFPRTLKKLTLDGGHLPWEDMSLVGSLPNLQVLKLKNHACDGDLWETTNGEFPELKYLLIEGSNITHWVTESSHFPRLKCLVLHYCPYLTEIPDNIGEIPTLEVIEVDFMSQSLMNSAKRIQEDQQSYGNDALQVRRIHYESVLKHTLRNGKWRYTQGQGSGKAKSKVVSLYRADQML